MKTKSQLYFKNEDSTSCYLLEDHLAEAREEGLSEITLLRAVPDLHSDYVWCTYAGDVSERCECRKSECSYYKPNRSGRGACVHRGRLFRHGEEETFREPFEDAYKETYTVKTKFVFEGEFHIKAKSKAEAREFVEKHCGLVIGGDIHSSLPDENVSWDFPVYPEKIVSNGKIEH